MSDSLKLRKNAQGAEGQYPLFAVLFVYKFRFISLPDKSLVIYHKQTEKFVQVFP